MFPVFSVLFPVCSQLKTGQTKDVPSVLVVRPSYEMKIEKISGNLWIYWEHEEQWERGRLSTSYGVPSKD